MTTFPHGGNLPELQKYVQDKCRERGFDSAHNLETFLLFSEEVGEMAKAMRKYQGLFQEQDQKTEEVQLRREHLGEEMADVLSYLLELANRYQIDLEASFQRKETINDQRQWKSEK